MNLAREQGLRRDRALSSPAAPRRWRFRCRLSGARPGAQPGGGPQGSSRRERGGALPAEARVPGPRRHRPHEPRPIARASRARGSVVLHDGAHRRGQLPRVRARHALSGTRGFRGADRGRGRARRISRPPRAGAERRRPPPHGPGARGVAGSGVHGSAAARFGPAPRGRATGGRGDRGSARCRAASSGHQAVQRPRIARGPRDPARLRNGDRPFRLGIEAEHFRRRNPGVHVAGAGLRPSALGGDGLVQPGSHALRGSHRTVAVHRHLHRDDVGQAKQGRAGAPRPRARAARRPQRSLRRPDAPRAVPAAGGQGDPRAPRCPRSRRPSDRPPPRRRCRPSPPSSDAGSIWPCCGPRSIRPARAPPRSFACTARPAPARPPSRVVSCRARAGPAPSCWPDAATSGSPSPTRRSTAWSTLSASS